MQHIGLLFWLKWKLLLRGYRRNVSEWVGALLMVLILLPISLGIAFWFGIHFVREPVPENANWLRTALLAIYAFWIVIPILGYSLNDSYDITKLFVYPLSMRQIFTGTILGTLMDRPTLLLLPTFVAIGVGFISDPISGIVTFLALVLFLFHTLALSQAVLMAGAGLFQSRKFRDTAVVLLPLIWVVYYMRFFVARQARFEQWATFVHSPAWEWVNYLPPGWAARAIFEAHRGAYGMALMYLAGLAAFTVGTFTLAGWTLQKIYSGEAVSAPSAPPPAVAPPIREGAPKQIAEVPANSKEVRVLSLVPGWVPQTIRAVADKEFRYLVRDPYYKLVMVNMLWPLLLPIFMSAAMASGEHAARNLLGTGWELWLGPGVMAFSQMQLTYNIFGTEGGAIALLFLFPAKRRQIVLGKNLFHFILLSAFNLAMSCVVYVMSHDFGLTGLLLYWMELALLLNIALGNVFSLYFPMRVVMRGWRVQYRSSGQGCMFFFIYLVIWLLSIILFVPVIAALAIPMSEMFGVSRNWLALSLPFGAAYVGAIIVFSLYLVKLLMPRREEPIISKVSQEPQ